MAKAKTLGLMSIAGALLMLSNVGANLHLGDADFIKNATPPVENIDGNDIDVNFNFNWQFQLGEVEEGYKVDYDDSSWRTLNLPHDWSVEQDFSSAIPAAMGKLPAGIGWYRKTFTLPSNITDRDIYINFDGAYMDSKVYLNGTFLGEYPYGYTPFSYKLPSEKLNFGGNNVIAVRIDSPLGNGRNSSRWYAGAGINRDVTLSLDNPVHFVKDGISIRDTIAGNSKADFVVLKPTAEQLKAPSNQNVGVTITSEVTNTGKDTVNAKIRVTLLDYNTGAVVKEASDSQEQQIAPNATAKISLTDTIPEVKLWDNQNPNLYNFKVETVLGDTVTDTQIVRYGFRKVLYTREGFYLNGKYMKLQGVNLHHDQGSLGAVSYEASVQRQMRIMREMGVNAIRTSHNVPTAQFLKAADEQGLMLMEEFYDTWTTRKNSDDYHKWFEKEVPTNENHPLLQQGDLWSDYDIRMSVRRDQNSPSVIMWSVGNEIYDTNQGQWSVDTVNRLIKAVHDVDTSRAVTMGFPMWHGAGQAINNLNSWSTKVANELDIVGLNYPDTKKGYTKYAQEHPDWILFGSETSSAWKSRGVFAINQGLVNYLDRQISEFDNADHFNSMRNEWVADRDSLDSLGQFIWTGFDYIGEPQPYDGGSNSAKSSYYGSVDTAGFKKAEFWMLKSQWVSKETEPFVKITNHINVEDEALRNAISMDNGNTIQLWISSNLSSVSLSIINDDGSETLVDWRDWNQAVSSTNPKVNLQEPLGNPTDKLTGKNSLDQKLYQIFTLNWNEVKGKKVIARGYEKPKAEAEKTPEVVAASDIVSSNTGSEKVVLTPETTSIKSDGNDLSYITVDITDSQGVINPNASNEVYFSIQGDGEILGVDNGDPTSQERYKAGKDGVWKRKAFMGKALVIVRSTREAGSFTLTGRSDGLATGVTKVLTKAEADTSVSYVTEVTSLIVKVGLKKEEVEALLPAKVKVLGSDGSKADVDVSWDSGLLTDEDLSHDNEIHLLGTLGDPKYADLKAELVISVTGSVIQALEGVTVTTRTGVAPVLPSTISVVDNNSTVVSKASVTWEDVDPSRYEKQGFVKVKGTASFNGSHVTVYALVRVVAVDPKYDTSEENIALKSSVTPSYVEGGHLASYVNDGKYDLSQGWGNWENHNKIRNDDYLDFDLGGESTVSSVNVLMLGGGDMDHAWYAMRPKDSIRVQYLVGSTWRDVTNIKNNTNLKTYGDKSGAANINDSINRLTFDAVKTSKIRVIFHIDDPNSVSHANNGDNTMLKVSEVEIIGIPHPLSHYLSSEAKLGNIWVGIKEIEGFDSNVYNYTYALKKGQAVPKVYVDSALNSKVTILNTENPYGKTVIKVTSEDGRNTATYVIQFTVSE